MRHRRSMPCKVFVFVPRPYVIFPRPPFILPQSFQRISAPTFPATSKGHSCSTSLRRNLLSFHSPFRGNENSKSFFHKTSRSRSRHNFSKSRLNSFLAVQYGRVNSDFEITVLVAQTSEGNSKLPKNRISLNGNLNCTVFENLYIKVTNSVLANYYAEACSLAKTE